MAETVTIDGLTIDKGLYDFITDEAMPGTGVKADAFWPAFAAIVHDLAPKNRDLLAKRDDLQAKLDAWYRDHREDGYEMPEYKAFLEEIGYLVPEGGAFAVTTENVDPEIADVAGPQLVVPIMNARFALNAANARWGSLYDALYGTDALGDLPEGWGYDPSAAARVIVNGRRRSSTKPFRLPAVPGPTCREIQPRGRKSRAEYSRRLRRRFADPGSMPDMARERGERPSTSCCRTTASCRDLDRSGDHEIGKTDPAGIADRLAGIGPDDDHGLRGFGRRRRRRGQDAGLSQLARPDEGRPRRRGSPRAARRVTRKLQDDFGLHGAGRNGLPRQGPLADAGAQCRPPDDQPGRPSTSDGNEVPEGIMDAMMTALIALHDIGPKGRKANSTKGSMYVVKPKMHGPAEVAFAVELFSRVEDALGMARNTIKMGIMDEERRTTINLKECIRAAKERVVFINTGFLDRTGDEIHTSMELGPMIRKGDMKQAAWIQAYENWNVDIGLECGLSGHAQIGKGMWAMPDLMHDMLEQKIGHPKAGANTAWVPSPTAATLHATHYHKVDVKAVQEKLKSRGRAKLDDILSVPVARRPNWTPEDIQRELDNNAQGILGYVVRWVDQGVGCSKVPDINDVALMEDRATLRISSQHMANWLHHGIVAEHEIVETMQRMAKVVDRQNEGDPAYRPMAPDYDKSIAFQAALDLVLKGREQPSGYTEPILHKRRLELKASQA